MSNNKEVKSTLAEVVSLMLIAVKQGDMIVFPKEDDSVDYIQLLEDCNKRPLLTYILKDGDGECELDCYDAKEINNILRLILSRGYEILRIKVN